MRELEILKEIALSIEHLKALRRSKNSDDSDKEVAKAINATGATFEGWEELRPNRLNLFRYGRDGAKIGQHSIILNAVRTTIAAEDARINVADMDRRYRHKLGPLLNQRTSHFFEGQELGKDTANQIAGAWQFFYLSPIDRDRRARPQFRGIGVFVHRALPTSKTIEFFVISGHGRWDGEAFINQSHIYLMCNDPNGKEAAFFLMNKPKPNQPFLAGVGAGLERMVDRPIRPALGFFCFGLKATPKALSERASRQKNHNSHKTVDLDSVIRRATGQDHLEEHEINLLRELFCKAYSTAELRREFRPMHDFIQEIRINGESDYSKRTRPWLYLEWPE